MREARIDRAGCFAYSPIEGAPANELPAPCRMRCAKNDARASWPWPKRCPRQAAVPRRADPAGAGRFWPQRSAARVAGRSYADAPEIDGTVRLLAPAKASTQLRVGQFARAPWRPGHDLIGEPL